jgi:hypothetical protein
MNIKRPAMKHLTLLGLLTVTTLPPVGKYLLYIFLSPEYLKVLLDNIKSQPYSDSCAFYT